MNKILSILLVVPFLMSTMGFVVYLSHCSCSGEDSVSVFVESECCESMHHDHHASESMCSCGDSESSTCNLDESGCNCQLPDFQYFKLDEKVVGFQGRIDLAVSYELELFATELSQFGLVVDVEENEWLGSNDPPPVLYPDTDYLNFICQLKIPVKA